MSLPVGAKQSTGPIAPPPATGRSILKRASLSLSNSSISSITSLRSDSQAPSLNPAFQQEAPPFLTQYADEFEANLLELAKSHGLERATAERAVSELKRVFIAYRSQKYETSELLLERSEKLSFDRLTSRLDGDGPTLLHILGFPAADSERLIRNYHILGVEALLLREFQDPREPLSEDFLAWVDKLLSTTDEAEQQELLRRPYVSLLIGGPLVSEKDSKKLMPLFQEISHSRHRKMLDIETETNDLLLLYLLVSQKHPPSSSALQRAANYCQRVVDNLNVLKNKRLSYEKAILEFAALLLSKTAGQNPPQSLLELLPDPFKSWLDDYPLKRVRGCYDSYNRHLLYKGRRLLEEIGLARIEAKFRTSKKGDRSAWVERAVKIWNYRTLTFEEVPETLLRQFMTIYFDSLNSEGVLVPDEITTDQKVALNKVLCQILIEKQKKDSWDHFYYLTLKDVRESLDDTNFDQLLQLYERRGLFPWDPDHWQWHAWAEELRQQAPATFQKMEQAKDYQHRKDPIDRVQGILQTICRGHDARWKLHSFSLKDLVH